MAKSNAAKRTHKLLGEMQTALTLIEKDSIRLKDSKETQRRVARLIEATLRPRYERLGRQLDRYERGKKSQRVVAVALRPLYKQLGLQLLGFHSQGNGITE